jgi:hypothetical protein
VDVLYWVTVRISQQVPQLFSAILGNGMGTVSARATAAIAESEVLGSLILINRETDMAGPPNPPSSAPPAGTNLEAGGGVTVDVPGGIILASNSSTTSHEAGRV